ncbi:MAG: diaminopimelate epimerase [Gemmatimonadaceae bacterium]
MSDAVGSAALRRLRFWKLTGSGNDFVFFDARGGPPEAVGEYLSAAAFIDAVCDRRKGIGADGIVLLERPVEPDERYSIRYFNRDGSLAEMCGNAALCSVRLADVLGVVKSGARRRKEKAQEGEGDGDGDGTRFTFHTTSGKLVGQLTGDAADPEIEMPAPTEVAAEHDITLMRDEERIGFARVGVPHLVLRVKDISDVDVGARGRELRSHKGLRDGANVNFVAPADANSWAMRTYERGVEAETLACGSGAVAVASLLAAWHEVSPGAPVTITTSSGRSVQVSWIASGQRIVPFLQGEGRLVFEGTVIDLAPSRALSTWP